MSIIEVQDLTKTFKTFSRREGVLGSLKDLFHRDYTDLVAVDSISFDVAEGELLGYIGPNGAGKSTSIKMLTGILKPTSGKMKVMGFDPYKERKDYTMNIGVVFGQRTQLWWDIAVIESFKLLGKIYQVDSKLVNQRIDMFAELLEMGDFLRRPVRKLSLGQRIRSDLVASLLHNPKLLFLDEPTIGLDAVAKDSVRNFLRHINKELKTTIILTTHDLREIEELCKRIIVIDKGRIIYEGSLNKLKNAPGLKRRLVLDFSGDVPFQSIEQSLNGLVEFEQEGSRRLIVKFAPKNIQSLDLINKIVSVHEVADFTITEPDIEDVIVKIYKDSNLV